MVLATRKLWLTADKETLVEDGAHGAAFLFCSPGDELVDEDADRYRKAKAKPADKQAEAPANKGGLTATKAG